jgi:hypothetical protein
MSRVDARTPHMGAEESRICAANLAGITPAAALNGYALIALSDPADSMPVLVSDLSRPQVVAVLAGVLAVLTAEAIGGQS